MSTFGKKHTNCKLSEHLAISVNITKVPLLKILLITSIFKDGLDYYVQKTDFLDIMPLSINNHVTNMTNSELF